MTSGFAFFAAENLKAGKWTFAVYPEVNSSCVVRRWDASPRRTSGVTRRRKFLLIQLRSIGDMLCLTNGNLAGLNQRCECRPVAYDWGNS
jgi:hypothetical protein